MTLLKRLTMALIGAIVVLHASAAPIEFTPNDFELATPGDAPALSAWFEEDNVYLKRLGDIDLDAALPAPMQASPLAVSVPEPVHYKLLLIGVVLLLLVGARRRDSSPWNSIKVSQHAD